MAGSSVGGGASSSAALASDKGTIRAAQAAAARAKAAEVAPEDLIQVRVAAQHRPSRTGTLTTARTGVAALAHAQAVVLADSFNKRFQPLTTALPKVRRRQARAGTNHQATCLG